VSGGAAPGAPGRDAGTRERAGIEVLDPLVADQIAAGEVIERPASVVKELVENALDAGAHEIEVEIRAGGRDLIVVRDDGEGMRAADAERACLRHATSKLRRLEDLAVIASHGFRGEALASIAAVAEVTITTRVRDEDAGVRVAVAGGSRRETAPIGAPPGTTIEVRGLFETLPARRKFLRSAATETSHVTELLQRLALVRPTVGFACRQGGRDLARYPAVARGEERLRQVLGAARARGMLAIAAEEGELSVRGFASRAGESFPQAKGVLTYVNGRLVRDRLLLRAILDAYRALLPQGRYPLAVLSVELPGALVDVNVHPTKTEVRFSRGDAVYAAVLRAVRSALAAGVVAPRANPEPPARDGDGPVAPECGGAASAPGARAFEAAAGATATTEPWGARVAEALERYASRADAEAGRSPDESGGTRSVHGWSQEGVGRRGDRSVQGGLALTPASAAGVGAVATGDTSAAVVPRFADLRVIGQVFAGYIVCEGMDALVLVDQHAAHERVRLERLRAAGTFDPKAGPPSQKLLVPRVVELDAAACAALVAAGPELAEAGFEVEPFGERSLLVRALPAALDVSTDADVLLARVAADLDESACGEGLEAARDALLARIACHGAVRAGDALAAEEMARIVADLDTIPFAATCPHGRPLLYELSRSEIARRVRRA